MSCKTTLHEAENLDPAGKPSCGDVFNSDTFDFYLYISIYIKLIIHVV